MQTFELPPSQKILELCLNGSLFDKILAAKLLIKSTWTQKIFDRAIQELSNGILTYSFQIILTEDIVIESSRVLPNYLKLSLVKRFCTLRNVLCTKLSVLL